MEVVHQFARERGTKPVSIWFDGGIRNGRDIVKAIALGADYVSIGRPTLLGLACDGQKGVQRVIETLQREMKQAMLECGCYSIQDIKSKNIIYSQRELAYARL